MTNTRNTRNGTGKACVLALLMLVLASCAPVAANDPSLIAAAAQARANAEAAQATASSAEYVARANEMALTATAEAPSVQATAQMAALEVYSTRQAVDATSTAWSWTPTPSQTPTPDLQATATVSQLRAEQTMTAKQAGDYIITSELELRRKVSINQFYANLPVLVFMLIAAIIGISLFTVVRSKRYQPVPVNAHGEVLPVIDIYARSMNDTRRMPNYRGYSDDNMIRDMLLAYIVRKLQITPALPEITSERQDAATMRAQTVELARATGQTRQLPPVNFPMLANPAAVSGERFEVVDGASALDDLGPEIMEILEAQWRDV